MISSAAAARKAKPKTKPPSLRRSTRLTCKDSTKKELLQESQPPPPTELSCDKNEFFVDCSNQVTTVTSLGPPTKVLSHDFLHATKEEPNSIIFKKIFDCIGCMNTTFERGSIYAKHLRKFHNISFEKIQHIMSIEDETASHNVCVTCEEFFENIHDLNNHNNSKHCLKLKLKKCLICSNTFHTDEELKKHIELHDLESTKDLGEMTYVSTIKCEFCSQQYKSNVALKAHLRFCKMKLSAVVPSIPIVKIKRQKSTHHEPSKKLAKLSKFDEIITLTSTDEKKNAFIEPKLECLDNSDLTEMHQTEMKLTVNNSDKKPENSESLEENNDEHHYNEMCDGNSFAESTDEELLPPKSSSVKKKKILITDSPNKSKQNSTKFRLSHIDRDDVPERVRKPTHVEARTEDRLSENRPVSTTTTTKLKNKRVFNRTAKKLLCIQCPDKKFNQMNRFLLHLRKFHRKSNDEIKSELDQLTETSVLLCQFCVKYYHKQNRSAFELHLQKHGPNGELRHLCSLCETFFATRNELLNHKQTNHLSEIKCLNCTSAFTTAKGLSLHMRQCKSKTGTQLVEKQTTKKYHRQRIEHIINLDCFLCTDSKFFKHSHTFSQHLRMVHNKTEEDIKCILEANNKSYISIFCKICGKCYKSEEALVYHINHHGPDGNLTHRCRICSKYFESKESLNLHNESMHKDKTTCRICHKTYVTPEVMQIHMKRYHAETPKKQNNKYTFICTKCGRTFKSKTSWSDHELSNCGKDPIHVCKECDKGYNSAGALKHHMSIHTLQYKFKCDFCDKKFRDKYQCKNHTRVHTKERPYQCPQCEKAFGSISTLFVHMSLHTGIKRYVCTTCDNRFSCITGLKGHWRTNAATCGANPDKSTKPVGEYMGFQNGKIVYTKKPQPES